MILNKINLSIGLMEWIMACVTSVNYAVLINGLPSYFFNASRGLK